MSNQRFGLAALIVAVGFVAIVVFACDRANDYIDKCHDPSSGTYISDPAERARLCAK
jgi:hypothetical protein